MNNKIEQYMRRRGIIVKDVPADRKLTIESFNKLEREISSQIDANDNMRYRSYLHKSNLAFTIF